ncbi:leucine-rich repeat domain-containing protein [Chthoniobacter flavus]|uniref:hypothetical protein n=1 Tax=Chthoniobacter flavus TaxID=191863 RepID=UPI001044B8AB|nr:hypothetical protein [Chthoniobacter flavus]
MISLPLTASAVSDAPPPSIHLSLEATPGKLPQQQILDKLFALGASVWIKKGQDAVVQIKSSAEVAGQKVALVRVEFPAQYPDEKPLAADDYAILDFLTDLPELSLSGEQVSDAVLEKLRTFRLLGNLTLANLKLSPASHNLLLALPELHELHLIATDTNDQTLKTIVQCRKLKSLHLDTLPITDDGLAILTKLPLLEELELSNLEKLGSPGFAHLVDCHGLKSLYVSGFSILSGMVENIARCKNLETLSLLGTELKDAGIAPLSALTKLHSLDCSGSGVSGTAFAAWPVRSQLTSLNLDRTPGVDDAICKNIEHAFPKLEYLNVKLADSGFTPAGAGILARLHSLHTLNLGGAGINDEVVAQLARNDALNMLAIPMAQLSEKGVVALAKIPHLNELSLNVPPVTDAAVKAFARCKELKTLNIGKDAASDTELKLHKVLPQLMFTQATE